MSGDLVGSRISLISRKDIRWEGILVQVDRENASVTLQNVKSWGTEERVEGEQIPPSASLHGCVNFRGEDIKDLHVHEAVDPLPAPPSSAPAPAVAAPSTTPPSQAPPPQAAPATGVASDGAAGGRAPLAQVPSDAPASTAPAAEPAGAPEGDSDAGETPAMMRDQGLKPGRYQPPHKNPNWKPPPTVNRGPPGPASGAGSGTGALPGQGNHLLNRRTRGAGGASSLDEEGEFDFQAGLAKFDKEKEMAILAGGISTASIHESSDNGGANSESADAGESGGTEGGEASGSFPDAAESATSKAGEEMGATGEAPASSGEPAAGAERRSAADGGDIWMEAPVVVKKYNKSSFFDEISCDALDGRGSRMPGGRGGERTRNTETFGATSVALSAGSRRFGGRGRGGGGYGGYSGGGHRGYSNNDDYRRGGGGGGDYGSRDRSYGNGGGGGGGGRDRQGSGGGDWRRT